MKETDTWKNHFGAFLRGWWDSVQFGYVPDYTPAEMDAWQRGYMHGKHGNCEPSIEDFESLCMQKNHETTG